MFDLKKDGFFYRLRVSYLKHGIFTARQPCSHLGYFDQVFSKGIEQALNSIDILMLHGYQA